MMFSLRFSLQDKSRHIFRQTLCVAVVAGATFSSLQPASAAPNRWVSDNISTYVRSGPTDGYRIVGTLQAGQPVTLISTQNDYSQVKTDDGKSVWLPSDQLQNTQGASARLPALQQEVDSLHQKLDGINDEWNNRVKSMQETLDGRKQYIGELEDTRTKLNDQLNDAQSQVRDLKGQVGNERQQVLMRYFAYGGAVGGIGLLLGLILPNMMPRRKKRNDRWF